MKMESVRRAPNRTASGALLVGGMAAILASTCCLGPLVLVGLGLSGAWIGNLTKVEPYRLYFLGGAVLALYLAGRRIFRRARACEPGEACAAPVNRRVSKILFGIVSALVLVALVYPYVAKFFY
jgi:mercuric ion transport protein